MKLDAVVGNLSRIGRAWRMAVFKRERRYIYIYREEREREGERERVIAFA